MTSFNSNGHACPECRTICRREPKREFAVRGIISFIFQAQNREEPTPASEGFDTDVFTQMYARAREERRNRRLRRQRLVAVSGGAEQAGVVDVQMVVDSDGSDWGRLAGGETSDEEL